MSKQPSGLRVGYSYTIIDATHPHTGETGIHRGDAIPFTGQYIIDFEDSCSHGKRDAAVLPHEVALQDIVNKAVPTVSKVGRPTDYTPDLADAICAELSEGVSLKRITDREGMPERQTVYRWLRTYPDFSDNYAKAKDDSADSLADEIADIADRVIDSDASRRLEPQAARVAMDGKKWIASKLKPKKYGDKLDLDAHVDGSLTIQTVNYADANTDDTA